MDICLGQATLVVREDQPISFRDASGAQLVCTSGVVWLTKENDVRDWHLQPGQRHVIETDGLILVEGAPLGSFCLMGKVSLRAVCN